MVPDVGFYRNDQCPRELYDRWDAINISTLKWLEYSPAHALEAKVNPPEPTPALEFGQALHVAVFEQHRWGELYQCGPVGDGRTKAVIAARQELERQYPHATILPAKTHAKIERMAGVVRGRPEVAELLAGEGRNEASFVWDDPPTGLRCKGRIDRITNVDGWSTVVDLKSCIDAREFAFASACARYAYHAAAAWYLDGLAQIAQVERRFLFIAVEKKPPFATRVYELGHPSLELGRRKWRQWLDTWASCGQTGRFPAYPTGVAPIELPEWAWKSDAPADLKAEQEETSPF